MMPPDGSVLVPIQCIKACDQPMELYELEVIPVQRYRGLLSWDWDWEYLYHRGIATWCSVGYWGLHTVACGMDFPGY